MIDLRALVRDIPDFPKAGILFRDITPVLGDAEAQAGAPPGVGPPGQALGHECLVGGAAPHPGRSCRACPDR